MIVIPSKELRNDYNKIATMAHDSKEPIYVTKNGYKDLVVMSADEFEIRDEMLALRHKIHAAEKSRLAGEPTYTVDEVFKELKDRYV